MRANDSSAAAERLSMLAGRFCTSASSCSVSSSSTSSSSSAGADSNSSSSSPVVCESRLRSFRTRC
eukprot:8123240-Heterocapsa_arctica.AAC.1